MGSTRGTSNTLHMAVDGDNVYGFIQVGMELFVSTNAGSSWASKFPPYKAIVSADIHVDPLTHDIYVFRAAPTVGWYSTSDKGTTWSGERETYADVDNLVSVFGSTGTDKFVYMAGAGTGLHRVNVTDESIQSVTVSASADNTTRSLAADSCGNVVSGNKTGSDLYMQYSTNSGGLFSAAALVTTGADRSSAAINPVNGDVMYLFEKSGHIYLTTYAGLLDGPPGTCYVASATATNTSAPTQTTIPTTTGVVATSTRTLSLTRSRTPSKTSSPTRTHTVSATPSMTATVTPTHIALMMKKGAVGSSFVLALLQDQTLVSWGKNDKLQSNIAPCCGSGIDDIAVGSNFALALKGGRVYGWGSNTLKQITFPSKVSSNIVAIAAGGSHGMALSNTGKVYAWGDGSALQTSVPKSLTAVVSIAAGTAHSLAVKSNGTVVAWGANTSKQSTVPTGLSNVIQVAGGSDHSLALKSNGTVVAWGSKTKGQSTVPTTVKDIKQISAGNQFSVAVSNSGTVFGWGSNTYNQITIPPAYTDIYTASAGYSNTILGLRSGGVIVLGALSNGVDASRTPTMSATATP